MVSHPQERGDMTGLARHYITCYGGGLQKAAAVGPVKILRFVAFRKTDQEKIVVDSAPLAPTSSPFVIGSFVLRLFSLLSAMSHNYLTIRDYTKYWTEHLVSRT